jgi:hypothetical protein
MATLEYLTAGEARHVRKLVGLILATGADVSVHDGDEWMVKRSRDNKTIIAALGTTGADTLRVRDMDGALLGDFELIYGNDSDGTEVISDHTANAYCDFMWNKLNIW